MIGRLRSRLDFYGTRTSWGLRQLISQQNDVAQVPLHFTWEMKPDSDHYTFYSRDIPVLMVHSGMHDDYHRPSDDVEKINYEGVKQVSQLLFGVLVELADAPKLTGFRRQARQETKYDQQNIERALSPPRGRLGLKIAGKSADEGQVVVSNVVHDSPADKAGIRVGDRFVTFAGQEVTDPAEFLVSVWSAASPAAATLERAGEEEPVEVSIELSGKPIRLGISWRTDEAEPGNVIVNRLTPGSAADRAGLKINDRIDRINDQSFASSDEFRKLASEAKGPIVLQVESGGKVRRVEVAVRE
jgi:C-terminal processing protease CtpA/Prc